MGELLRIIFGRSVGHGGEYLRLGFYADAIVATNLPQRDSPKPLLKGARNPALGPSDSSPNFFLVALVKRLVGSVLTAFVFLASVAEAQPVVVAAGAVSYSAASTAFTYPWTVQSNPHEELWVFPAMYGYTTAAKSVSLGATGFQFLTVAAAATASTKESLQAWCLTNPTAGTANIVATFANSQPATIGVVELDNTNEIFPPTYSIFGSTSMYMYPVWNLTVQKNLSLIFNTMGWVAPSTPTGVVSSVTSGFAFVNATYTGASNSSPSYVAYDQTNPNTGSVPMAVTLTQSVYVNDIYLEIDQPNTATPTWTPTATPTATPSPSPTPTPTPTATIPSVLQAAFSLDSPTNYADKSGNGVAAGPYGSPVYVTQSPVSVEGTGCLFGTTDANYVTISALALSGASAAGAYCFHVNVGNGATFGSSGESVIVSVGTAAAGESYFYNGGSGAGLCYFAVPTAAGKEQHAFTFAYQPGRWYYVLCDWNGTHADVYYAEDQPVLTWTHALNQTLSNAANFSSITNIYVGRDVTLTGYYCGFDIDAVAFYSGVPSPVPSGPLPFASYNWPRRILWIGDSRAQGTLGTSGGCGVASNADGYRYEFDRDRDSWWRPYEFVSGGSVPAQTGQRYTNTIDPFTAGVAGSEMGNTDFIGTSVLSRISANLSTAFPNPTSNDYAILAFDSINDCAAGVPLATFRAQMDAVVNSVVAYSSSVNFLYVLEPTNSAFCSSIGSYTAQEYQSYTTHLGLGNRVSILDLRSNTEVALCSDGEHPNATPVVGGYDALGDLLFYGFDPLMTTPTPTPTRTPCTTPPCPGTYIPFYRRIFWW